jgi:hypothetical protein
MVIVAIAATSVALPVGAQLSNVEAAPCLCSGGEFHPLTPQRIFDSRPATAVNDVAPPGAKPLAAPEPATFDIALLGQGGIPTDTANVLAVVVNITVSEPTANGYLEAYGKGARPADRTSIINFVPDQTVPNVAIVRPGADGALTIGLFGQSGTAQVIVDVFGWFSTSNYMAPTQAEDDGARLIPTTPARVLDTRAGALQVGHLGALGPKETVELQIRGADAINPTKTDVVPDSGDVTGVLLNMVGITQRPGGASTYLSLLPDAPAPGTNPSTSNLNMPPGVIKANLVFVPVGADGKVRIFNFQGQTDVVADVVGYLQKPTDHNSRAGRVVPLTSPYRTFDTRLPQFGGVALGPGQAETWSFADFASSVAIGAEAVGPQLAVIGNLTAASLKRQYATVPASSFLTAYPADASRPLSSNLNTVEGPPVPNMAVLTYGANDTVNFYNLAGYQDYLFDASAVVLSD